MLYVYHNRETPNWKPRNAARLEVIAPDAQRGPLPPGWGGARDRRDAKRFFWYSSTRASGTSQRLQGCGIQVSASVNASKERVGEVDWRLLHELLRQGL